MNAAAPNPSGGRGAFIADWRDFVFMHFTVPPASLARVTAFAPDCRGGAAFVSLVFFRLERMRPARGFPPALGRLLLRPTSDHWFLNLRAYIIGPQGPGIQFLTEWVDNPISLRLGPALYGLPYRSGRFEVQGVPDPGAAILHVLDRATGGTLDVGIRETNPGPPRPFDSFLVEKYLAYTERRGVARYFRIAHPPWTTRPAAVTGMTDRLIGRLCPWFREAELYSACVSEGFADVRMDCPHRCALANRAGGDIT